MLIHPKASRDVNAVLMEGFTSHLLVDECGSCTPGSAPMSSASQCGWKQHTVKALLCLPKSHLKQQFRIVFFTLIDHSQKRWISPQVLRRWWLIRANLCSLCEARWRKGLCLLLPSVIASLQISNCNFRNETFPALLSSIRTVRDGTDAVCRKPRELVVIPPPGLICIIIHLR